MKEKPGPDSIFLQMKQARQLLELGHHREALTLALDALLQELYNLRESLAALNDLSQPEPEPRRERPHLTLCRLPGDKPRTVH